jgi:hypothetical protein
VPRLSSRAARLYLMRLEWNLGFAVPSQLAARTRPHCRFVFLQSRVCSPLSSASPHGYALRSRYAYLHRLRRVPPNPIDTAHTGHTRAGVPARHERRGALSDKATGGQDHGSSITLACMIGPRSDSKVAANWSNPTVPVIMAGSGLAPKSSAVRP